METLRLKTMRPVPKRRSAGVLFGFALKHTHIRWKAAGLQHNSHTLLRLTSKFLNSPRAADSPLESSATLKNPGDILL